MSDVITAYGTGRGHASRNATALRKQSRQQMSLLEGPEYVWTPDDWATPPSLVEQLEQEFGRFELDPCATAQTAKAPRFYTAREDGLTQPWAPARVFCNPPYSNMSAWLRKAATEAERGAFVVCLVAAHTDRGWWHDLIEGKARVRFLRGRVKFLGGSGKPSNPTFGSALAIYGRSL